MRSVTILAGKYRDGYEAGIKYAIDAGFTPEHAIMAPFPLLIMSDEIDPPGKLMLTQHLGVAIICDDDAYMNTIVCLNGYTAEIMEINFTYGLGMVDDDEVDIEEDEPL